MATYEVLQKSFEKKSPCIMKSILQVSRRALGFQLKERVEHTRYALLDLLGLPNKDYSLVPSSKGVLVGSPLDVVVGSSWSIPLPGDQVYAWDMVTGAPLDVLVSSLSNVVIGSGWLMPLFGDQVCTWDRVTIAASPLAWEKKHGLG